MKLALIGYGGMGRALATVAKERGHSIVSIVDPLHPEATSKSLDSGSLNGAELAIEFTHPTAVIENIKTLISIGVPCIVGTTGWYDRKEEIKSLVESSKGSLLWSSNFSIGVNLYFRIIEQAATLLGKFDEYDVWGTELHHRAKADSPSGTAKSLEEIILKAIPRKKKVAEEKLDRRLEADEFHFSSTRGGSVNFSHTIGFDSAADTITVTHAARNREGYALGAMKAAEWLLGKRGFFSMQDFLAT